MIQRIIVTDGIGMQKSINKRQESIMVMLNKIRSFFKKGPEQITVTRSDLPAFIDERLREEGVDSYTTSLDEELHEKANLLDERSDVLKNATLKNENIPSRAKTIMQGNREQYIVKTHEFAEELRKDATGLKEINSPADVVEKLSQLRKQVESFSKNTNKQYQILQEFFANESYRIAEVIRDTDRLCERTISELRGSELFTFHRVREMLKDIEGLARKKADLQGQIESHRSAFESERKEEERLKTSYKKILDSDEHAAYEGLKREAEERKKTVQALRDEIGRPFMTMSRALRKFSKVSVQEKLVKGLLSHPSRTVVQEKSQDIHEALSRLVESLPTLGLKDNVAKKTKDQVDAISQEWISQKAHELSKASQELDEIEQKVSESSIPEDLKAIEGKIERSRHRQAEIEGEIKEREKQLEASNEDDIYKKIRALLEKHNIILDSYREEPSA